MQATKPLQRLEIQLSCCLVSRIDWRSDRLLSFVRPEVDRVPLLQDLAVAERAEGRGCMHVELGSAEGDNAEVVGHGSTEKRRREGSHSMPAVSKHASEN